MCGIVGYITLRDETRIYSKEKFFREALFTDTLRGKDSTGVMHLSGDFDWGWQKNILPGTKFIETKDFIERDQHTWCQVGHNRSATIGNVTVDNAHPFEHKERIILVHNGTLNSTFDLEHRNVNCTVDSDLIAYNLAEEEPDQAAKVLGRLSGAYALVWFDTQDQSVNIARNAQRPFHLGINQAEDILLFASDGAMLRFCSDRLLDHQSKSADIFQIKTGEILKYKKGSLVPEVTSIIPFIPYRHSTLYPGRGATTKTGFRSAESDDWKEFDNPLTTSNDPSSFRACRPAGFRASRGKMVLGGQVRRIPAAHTTMLEDWYSLRHDQELLFCPKGYQPWGTSGYGAVYGKVYHAEWQSYFDAYVGNCTTHTWKMYKNEQWTVCPVGVDHTQPKKNTKGGCTLIVACKLFRYWGKMPWGEDSPHDAYIKGPHGNITTDAFVKLTQDGCAMCGGPIFIADHEELIWVGEMSNQPLCMTCLDFYTDKDNDGKDLIV